MLPTGKQDKGTAIQVVLYAIWTVLASLIPAFHVTGSLKLSLLAAMAIGGIGIWLIYYALRLYRLKTDKSAKQLMLVSVSYITLLQIIFVLDKFLN